MFERLKGYYFIKVKVQIELDICGVLFVSFEDGILRVLTVCDILYFICQVLD